jgi:ribosomal protein S18 acetylase RimI-like enzyme
MTVRVAKEADLPVLEELWRAFEREIPPPEYVDVDHERELNEIRAIVADGIAFVADRDGGVAGFALGRRTGTRLGYLSDVYVVPEARREGIASALVDAVVAELASRGAEFVDLEVQAGNVDARAVYKRWGFHETLVRLVAPVDELRRRLHPDQHATSFGSIHLQTDDRPAVERASAQYAPRIGSKSSRVEGPRNGWTAVYDEVVDRDPSVLLRYARELSERMGIVVVALSLELDQVVRMIALDRGGIVDEYLSVPEFYGQLPPGDVIGLAANPTVLARLTGADSAAVRDAAPTAAAAHELPRPRELLARLAAVLGIEGAEYGYSRDEG